MSFNFYGQKNICFSFLGPKETQRLNMMAEGPSEATEGQAGSGAHGPAPVPVPRELMKAPLTLNM